MPYVSQQEMIDRFGEDELIRLSDRAAAPAGVIDAAIIDTAIADADDLIDSYIVRRYDLPLARTPSRLTKVASDIARFHLYKDGAIESVAEAHKEAIRFLKDVAAGRAELDIGGEEPAASPSMGAHVGGGAATFTTESLKGYS